MKKLIIILFILAVITNKRFLVNAENINEEETEFDVYIVDDKNNELDTTQSLDEVMINEESSIVETEDTLLAEHYENEEDTVFEENIDESRENEEDTVFEEKIDELTENEEDTVFEENIDESRENEEDAVFEENIDESRENEEDTVFEENIDESTENEEDTVFEENIDESIESDVEISEEIIEEYDVDVLISKEESDAKKEKAKKETTLVEEKKEDTQETIIDEILNTEETIEFEEENKEEVKTANNNAEIIEEIHEKTIDVKEKIIESESEKDEQEKEIEKKAVVETKEVVEKEATLEEKEEEIIIEEEVVEEEIITAAVKNTTIKNNGNDKNLNGFVTRLYQNVLNRNPDKNGLSYWVNGLQSGKITGSEALTGFFTSNEMKNKNLTNEAFIEELYNTVLNRKSDNGGLEYWKDRLDIQMSREYVINGFASSKEFSSMCKKYGVKKGDIKVTRNYRDKNYEVTAFVDRMYKNTLDRAADIHGLEYWCEGLINKQSSGATLAKGFFESKEFINKKLNDTEFLEISYQTILGRKSDKSGVKYWQSQLDGIFSRDYVLKGFVESNEFNNICKSYKINVGTYETTNMFKEVKNNEMPYYSQLDIKWKYKYYGFYTFGNTGCTETSLAMIYSGLSGSEILPTDVADYLYNHTESFNRGIYLGTGGIGIKLATDHFGFNLLPLKTAGELKQALKAGHYVVAVVEKGVFFQRDAIHTVALNGYSDGKTFTHDPSNDKNNDWHNIDKLFETRSSEPLAMYEDALFFMIYK